MTLQIEFKGKRVVVCGGSRGIGRSIALGFARAGAAVSICARSAAALAATRDELAAFGGVAHSASCDLASADAIAAYIPAAAQALGGIDILINNASGFGMGDDEAAWTASVDVDLMAVVRASTAALPYLLASPAGAIVNISSIAGLRASSNPAYGAVKAAVIHYTASQAAKLATRRVRVNCVSPGSIEFPGGLWAERKAADPAFYNRVLARIPFGRMGLPEEIANTVLFLASPLAGWITGQSLVVDGGQALGV